MDERRRSPRLQENGYYSADGRPSINYSDSPRRSPKKSGQRSPTAPPAVDGFVTGHAFIISLCVIVWVSCISMTYISLMLREQPKMKSNESVQLSVPDQSLKTPSDESIQPSVPDQSLKTPSDESIQPSVPDQSLKTPSDESVQPSIPDQSLKTTSDETILSPKPDGQRNFPGKSQDFTILGSRSSDTYARMGYIEKMLNWMFPKHAWILHKWQNLVPGFCWPFQGSAGQLHVQLDKPTHISHVTVGHITKAQSPTGENLSAPRLFSVHGVESSDNSETLLGRFEFDASGEAFQTFPVDPAVQKAFKDVRLNVESNWGNSEYTCLYNFRVHETPVQP